MVKYEVGASTVYPASGPAEVVIVDCEGYWVRFSRVSGVGKNTTFRFTGKGPNYRGGWPSIPDNIFAAMTRKAAAIFKDPNR